jgi:hypothetical protein
VASRAIVKIVAHTGDATTLDWHPTRPYVIATGGAGDRCVKGTNKLLVSAKQNTTCSHHHDFLLLVWNLESYVNMNKRDENIAINSGTTNTVKSELSTNSDDSSETERSSG